MAPQNDRAEEFFGLHRSSAATWLLPVVTPLCSGTGALFGGVAFGAAVAVLQSFTGRELVWAAIQFTSHVRPPSVLRLDVEQLALGRRATQARVTARVDDREMWSMAATLGERDNSLARASWPIRPSVKAPLDCPPRPLLERHRGRFMERVQARIATHNPGPAADGRSAVWACIPNLTPDAVSLAVFGDYVPFGLRYALGDGFESHSLDNTLRVLRVPGTADPGWVLADVAITGVEGGYGHGRVHLWDEEGRLVGTASQSFTCRPRS